jgi:hypothetical protein
MMLSRVKVPGRLSNLDDDALTIADVSSGRPQLITYVKGHERVKTQRATNVFPAPTRRLVWKPYHSLIYSSETPLVWDG